MHSPSAAILAFLTFGLFGNAALGQEARDMKLEDVGFVMRTANTTQQMERLRSLPPRTFVARTKAGRRYYIYADPDYCRCVFLGGDSAMRNYRDLVNPPPLPPMPSGPANAPPPGPLTIEIAPDIDLTIGDGDILDYSY
jgi:hypothetical protein